MQVYGLKNCDTCRKAVKALPGAELVDIRDNPIEPALLERAYRTFGRALVNTRSTTWRNLGETERQAPPLDLLKAHPALMKRPLIVAGDDLYLGWGADVRAGLGAD